MQIQPELKTVQKRFRLSGILATCPTAGPYARKKNLITRTFWNQYSPTKTKGVRWVGELCNTGLASPVWPGSLVAFAERLNGLARRRRSIRIPDLPQCDLTLGICSLIYDDATGLVLNPVGIEVAWSH